ncbi:hypothetical protein SUGI_1078510 [Cryptomeria japonica]|uniref:stress enhanced protein 2, chloroplastic n=1 Tax=Cryptomeria japonica TaxID=3369 RepID=UPI0024149B8C|nr:stress enhanced protein 2, chloroplastic [Cryptomeria japonica]GLJ50627.1 hypothetical protein SUGI_1078510 [Cryptomeria japonica]
MAGLLKSQPLVTRNLKSYCLAPRIPSGSVPVRSELGAPQIKSPDGLAAENSGRLLYYPGGGSRVSRVSVSNDNNKDAKIMLPPRLCTLRAFGKSADGMVKAEPDRMSSFFTSLAASIDHSNKIKDWEILSGRMAMIVFAAAINVELLTGNSLFQKMDVQKICEFGGVCLASIFCAAGLAWASRAKSQVANIFSARCNEFVDTVIDQLVDGLFYEEEQD